MSMQASTLNKNFSFILDGEPKSLNGQTILTNGARATALVFGTVMAQVSASKKWVPLTDETATDGTCTAKGIYYGEDIAAADIAAGDVGNALILVGGPCTVDVQQVVVENSKTLNTVVGANTVNSRLVRDDLARVGIFMEDTLDIDKGEN